MNPSTRPSDDTTHETVDHFLSLILVCLLGGMFQNMWKRGVSESRKICAGWCLGTKDMARCPNTSLCPLARRLQPMVGMELVAC